MRYVTHSDRSFGMTVNPANSDDACIDATVLMDTIIGMRAGMTKKYYETPKDSPGVQRIETAVNHLTLWLYGRLAFTGIFFRSMRKALRMARKKSGAQDPGSE